MCFKIFWFDFFKKKTTCPVTLQRTELQAKHGGPSYPNNKTPCCDSCSSKGTSCSKIDEDYILDLGKMFVFQIGDHITSISFSSEERESVFMRFYILLHGLTQYCFLIFLANYEEL